MRSLRPSSRRLGGVLPRPRDARRGQELVEFSILFLFFLFIFCSSFQVCFTAIEKFHLNHVTLETARAWSSGPNGVGGIGVTLPPSGAYSFLKDREKSKKQNMGLKLTRSDGLRLNTKNVAGGGIDVSFSFPGGPNRPSWASLTALYSPSRTHTGVVATYKLPIVMPGADFVMGKGVLPNPPRYYGQRFIDAATFVPMEKEPKDIIDEDKKDNNGIAWSPGVPWPGNRFFATKVNINWFQMQDPDIGDAGE